MQSGDSSDGEISEVEVTDGGPMVITFRRNRVSLTVFVFKVFTCLFVVIV